MGIAIVVEGAKGTGKSTLIHDVKNYIYPDMFIRSFDSKIFLDVNLLMSDATDNKLYGYDRGFLSNQIYDWLRNVDITDPNATMPATIKAHHDLMMKKTDLQVILYASDHQMLFDAINNRHKTTGKGATAEELKLIRMSNMLFKLYGQILKALYPDKILLYDICVERPNLDDIKNLLLGQGDNA